MRSVLIRHRWMRKNGQAAQKEQMGKQPKSEQEAQRENVQAGGPEYIGGQAALRVYKGRAALREYKGQAAQGSIMAGSPLREHNGQAAQRVDNEQAA